MIWLRFAQDFERQVRRSLALPIAGAVVWTIVGIASLFLPEPSPYLVLLFGSSTMVPIALLVARPRGASVIDHTNPLASLLGMAVWMVNLLWTVHLTVGFHDPHDLPLTLGLGLGIHWIAFSWVLGHPVGIVHAMSILVLATRPSAKIQVAAT